MCSAELGNTSTLSGDIVSKNDAIIHFAGTADELNSHLGLVKAMSLNGNTRQFIERIQRNLMKLMSHASDITNEKYYLSKDEITVLEKEINRLSEKLPKMLQFVLPGKNITEAQIHIARTAARKTERLFVGVSDKMLCPNAGAYLNRLSDYLFVLSQQE